MRPATTPWTAAWLLLRLDLRRDRVVVAVWVAVLGLTAYASAAATTSLFDTAAERTAVAGSLDASGALRALYGPILDPTSVGELAMSKLTVLYALVSAVLYVVLVRRHTRVEEETGRAELTAGTALGRGAPLAAATVEGAGIAVLMGVVVALAVAAGGLPVAGAAWFGVSWTGTGLVATGVGAVACQLSASARTCGSAAALLLGAAYVVRAVGDAVDGWHRLVWLSPLGWNTQLRAWSDPRPWVAGLYVVLAAGLLALAQVMRAHRDLGAGLVPARAGPTHGSLRGVWDLTLRVHRSALLVSTVAAAAVGAAFGAIVPSLGDLLDTGGGAELVGRLGGSLLAALLPVAAIVVTCLPVSLVTGAHHDEETGRAGLVLTSTSRARWTAATGVVAAGSAAWLMLVTGAALGAGYAAAGGSGVLPVVTEALRWVPSVWVLTALSLVGLAVRSGWFGWAALSLCAVVAIVGELLELPGPIVALSPYAGSAPVVWALVSGLLGSAAWWWLRRRDLGP